MGLVVSDFQCSTFSCLLKALLQVDARGNSDSDTGHELLLAFFLFLLLLFFLSVWFLSRRRLVVFCLAAKKLGMVCVASLNCSSVLIKRLSCYWIYHVFVRSKLES